MPEPLWTRANEQFQCQQEETRHLQGIDLDRDDTGRLILARSTIVTSLPRHTATSSALVAARSQPPRSKPRPAVPENALTSPHRIEKAAIYARETRKRKRPDLILPPPAFTFQRSNNPDFNVFNDGILLYPELVFHLASHLPVSDLISLYSISKDFHTILDRRFTTVVLSQALRKAPLSARIFPFRCYAHLCRRDPAARLPHPDPQKRQLATPRTIPSFKWLRMILYREKTIQAISALFAQRGIPLPKRCSIVLRKIWFLLDIPDNARRIGFVHNPTMMSDVDLYFGACFMVKLDMLFNDPVSNNRHIAARRLIMAQPSLSMLLKVLKGDALHTRWDLLREWVLWHYIDPATALHPDALLPTEPRNSNTDETELLFGIPRAEWGRKAKEFWGKTPSVPKHASARDRPAFSPRKRDLMRPDQLLVREAIRRGLRFSGHYLKFLTYGYVHPKTLDNYDEADVQARMQERVPEWEDDEYGVDDVVAGVRALGVGEGGDRFLDLGGRKNDPRRSGMLKVERDERARETRVLAELHAEVARERAERGLVL
jgi:hypothetical protein